MTTLLLLAGTTLAVLWITQTVFCLVGYHRQLKSSA